MFGAFGFLMQPDATLILCLVSFFPPSLPFQPPDLSGWRPAKNGPRRRRSLPEATESDGQSDRKSCRLIIFQLAWIKALHVGILCGVLMFFTYVTPEHMIW